MKTYEDFTSSLIESELKNWDLSLVEKLTEWKSLDEETQVEIINGLVEGDESLIVEWGVLDEKIGTLARKAGGLVRKLPGLRTPIELGVAGYRAAKGDYTGAALSLGSAIPGPVGWGFVAADVARDLKKDSDANKKRVVTKPNQVKTNNQVQARRPVTQASRPSVGPAKTSTGKLRLTSGRMSS